MGLGVLEDRHMARPPGTSMLDDSQSKNDGSESVDISHAKKHGDLILNPQPSDSPNDPLNWSNVKKGSITVLLSIISAGTYSVSGMLTTAIPIVAADYGVSEDEVSRWAVGFLVFWTGTAAFFTAAGANVIGKRPFILGSLLIMVATNVWGAFPTTFSSLIALRTFQGIASAPYETMVTGSLSDLYFLHQRGTLLSSWSVVTSVGMSVGQVISGSIIERLTYRGAFGISSVVFTVLLVASYFINVETTYTKPRPKLGESVAKADVDQTDTAKSDSDKSGEPSLASTKSTFSLRKTDSETDAGSVFKVASYESQEGLAGKAGFTVTTHEVVAEEASEEGQTATKEKPETYASQLRILRGRVSDARFLSELVKPFPMVVCPAVLYGSIINGISFAILISVFLLTTIILSKPPYGLTPSKLALSHIPGVIVGLIASPISGWLADTAAKRMARRNGGVFEPEFRLVLLGIGVPITTMAIVGFGESVARQHPLPAVIAWLASLNLGLPFMVQGVLSYVLDCSGSDANLAFVAIGFFRSMFTFIGTSFTTGIMLAVGPRAFFFSMAAFNLAISLFTVPTYVYGKRMRSLVARSKVGKKLAREE